MDNIICIRGREHKLQVHLVSATPAPSPITNAPASNGPLAFFQPMLLFAFPLVSLRPLEVDTRNLFEGYDCTTVSYL